MFSDKLHQQHWRVKSEESEVDLEPLKYLSACSTLFTKPLKHMPSYRMELLPTFRGVFYNQKKLSCATHFLPCPKICPEPTNGPKWVFVKYGHIIYY